MQTAWVPSDVCRRATRSAASLHLDRSRHCNNQRRGGEEKPKVGIHAADKHVMRPHHHPITEDAFTRMHADQIGHDAEGRQCHDIHLGMAEEPEQMLEQQRTAAGVLRHLPHRDDGRHEEARAQRFVEQHHDAADKQCGKSQQGEYGGDENSPYSQRHAQQRHAFGTRLQYRGDIIQAAHGRRHNKNQQRYQHQDDAPVMPGRSLQNRLRRIQRPAGTGRTTRHEKAGHQHQHRQQVHPKAQHVQVGENHIPRAHNQRNQVIPKTAEEQSRQQINHHDHAVHGHELIVVRRVDEGKAAGETQLQTHQVRQCHADQPHRDGDAGIMNRDHLVILAPHIFSPEALRRVVCITLYIVPGIRHGVSSVLTLWLPRLRYMLRQIFLYSLLSALPCSAQGFDIDKQRSKFRLLYFQLGHDRRKTLHNLGGGVEYGFFQLGLIGRHARAVGQACRVAKQVFPARTNTAAAIDRMASHATLGLCQLPAMLQSCIGCVRAKRSASARSSSCHRHRKGRLSL